MNCPRRLKGPAPVRTGISTSAHLESMQQTTQGGEWGIQWGSHKVSEFQSQRFPLLTTGNRLRIRVALISRGGTERAQISICTIITETSQPNCKKSATCTEGRQDGAECRLGHGLWSHCGEAAGRPLGSTGEYFFTLNRTNQLRQAGERHGKHSFFSYVCVFNVEPQSYGRELKKCVYKIETEQNDAFF